MPVALVAPTLAVFHTGPHGIGLGGHAFEDRRAVNPLAAHLGDVLQQQLARVGRDVLELPRHPAAQPQLAQALALALGFGACHRLEDFTHRFVGASLPFGGHPTALLRFLHRRFTALAFGACFHRRHALAAHVDRLACTLLGFGLDALAGRCPLLGLADDQAAFATALVGLLLGGRLAPDLGLLDLGFLPLLGTGSGTFELGCGAAQGLPAGLVRRLGQGTLLAAPARPVRLDAEIGQQVAALDAKDAVTGSVTTLARRLMFGLLLGQDLLTTALGGSRVTVAL